MPHTETPAIEVADVHKRYGSQSVLEGVTLSVHHGVFALLGPNGAGKTTLIKIASTLLRPDRGTVRVMGHDVVRERRQVTRSISLTGQHSAVDEALTGSENLVLIGRLLGLRAKDARRRAQELLEVLELTPAARKPARTYSGGMRRRLDLAASLIGSPPVVFLDEPTTGLDTRSRQVLWNHITSLSRAGTTVLLTTQYLEEADVLADRVAVLDRGRIVAEGTPDELKRQVGGAVIEVEAVAGAPSREVTTDGTARGVAADLAALAADAPDARVVVRRPTMDEVFLQLTGHGEAVR